MSILKWQRVIDESVFSEGDLYLIAVESPQYRDRDLLDTKQFAAVGQKFFALATDLDRSFERWLQNWLNTSYGESDCVVPTDWEDWLATRTQQYVSVAFLDKYSEKNNLNWYNAIALQL